MSEFNVEIQRHDYCAVIRSEGYINNLGGEKISEECDLLFTENINQIILNLHKSSIVNSIGISILIEIIEKIIARQGKLAFCHLTPTINKTFRIMGLLQYAETFETESDAVTAMTCK